jgi:adenylosuccinate synthase
LNQHIDNGDKIVIEGTQGSALSLYHSFYPYCTSRDTNAAAFLAESGISPYAVRNTIMVIRTYPIRVAGPSGPLPREITWDEVSSRTGKETIEMTTVTKKVRRVAEFDPGVVQKAIRINRPTYIALQFLNYVFPELEGVDDWTDLTYAAREYIKHLERMLSVPILLIGTGRENEAMIDRR